MLQHLGIVRHLVDDEKDDVGGTHRAALDDIATRTMLAVLALLFILYCIPLRLLAGSRVGHEAGPRQSRLGDHEELEWSGGVAGVMS